MAAAAGAGIVQPKPATLGSREGFGFEGLLALLFFLFLGAAAGGTGGVGGRGGRGREEEGTLLDFLGEDAVGFVGVVGAGQEDGGYGGGFGGVIIIIIITTAIIVGAPFSVHRGEEDN